MKDFITYVLFLSISNFILGSSNLANASCPVDECAACGKTVEFLSIGAPTPAPPPFQVDFKALQRKVADLLKRDDPKNGCHVWQDKKNDSIFGCVDHGKCAQKTSEWKVYCGKYSKGASDCQSAYDTYWSNAGCDEHVNCVARTKGSEDHPLDTDPIECTVRSNNCMNPLHAYMSGMINYCPDGTDLIQNPENQYSDFPVCKWRENNSVKNTSDPRASEGARGK